MNTLDFLKRQIIPLVYRQIPDDGLMVRAATGDAEAFIVLMGRKYAGIEGLCRTLLGAHGPVEDIATEVFLQLWRQREWIQSPGAVDAWLRQTARNLALKSIAAEAKGRAAGREWWQRNRQADSLNEPLQAASEAELMRRVRRAIAELSERDRRVLTAAETVEGDDQAATALRLPVGTYRVRLHRARQRLLTILKRFGVAPVVGVITLVGGLKARAASAVAALWATSLGKAKLACLTFLMVAALVGGWMWTTAVPDHIPPVEPALPAGIVDAETPHERERKRMDRVFAPVIAEVEAGLKQIAFGNQAGARFREMRYDTGQPAAFFDWWHKHEADGKVLFERRSVVEVGYNAGVDGMEVWLYADGLDGPRTHIDHENPIIPFMSEKLGVRWSLELPAFKRAALRLEDVRDAYAIDKHFFDEIVTPVIPKLEALLQRMARGNEGDSRFVRLRYGAQSPTVKFAWNHREVRNGRVVFDLMEFVEIQYLAKHHVILVPFWQNKVARAPWHWLTPESNLAIDPFLPLSDANPRIPAEMLRELPGILEPITMHRNQLAGRGSTGGDVLGPPPILDYSKIGQPSKQDTQDKGPKN